MSRALCSFVSPYSRDNLLTEIDVLRREWCRQYENTSTRCCKLYVNRITYNKIARQINNNMSIPSCDTYTGDYGSILGIDIEIDNTMESFTFMIKEDEEMNIPKMNIPNMWAKGGIIPVKKLPKKYIINRGATVLFWEDGTKTVVKRAKDDEYNKIMGFLWAYFQKTSGLSRTKANEYLRGLVDADDLKAIEFIKSGELNNVMSDVAEGLSNAFKNIADSFKPKK